MNKSAILRGSQMECIVSVDIGTTGTKAALVSREGQLLASTYAGYELSSSSGVMEQNANDWWQAVCHSLQALWKEVPSAAPSAIVFSGQMQDVILADACDVISPVILYSDSRSQTEAAAVEELLGSAYLKSMTGNLQDASGLLAKLLWIKQNLPEVYRAASHLFIGAHDYVTWRLCGVCAADFTTAATTGLLDIDANDWAYIALEKLGLRVDWLPELTAGDQQVGQVSPAAADATGLPVGCPIFHGIGDAAAATLGAAAGEPGCQYVYLGTSGWLAATHTGDLIDPETGIFNLRHPDPSQMILIGPMITAAGNFEWLRRQFGALEILDPEGQTGDVYEALNYQAASSPVGSHGVLYLPYLSGERSPFRDANARGGFIGLSPETTRADLYRAVLEGVAFAMRSISDVMGKEQADKNLPLNLVGGGAKSPLWAQIFANVFNRPVHVLADPGDVGSRGAALVAGKGLGWFKNFNPGEAFFPVQAAYEPDPQHAAVYEKLYVVFRGLYPALKDSFAELAEAQNIQE
jgi:xylulokinase